MSQKKNINVNDVPDHYKDKEEFYKVFTERLADIQEFPGEYRFKFVLTNKADVLSQSKEIFGEDAKYSIKESSSAKYVSVTIVKNVRDAGAVAFYYKEAEKIEGVMML